MAARPRGARAGRLGGTARGGGQEPPGPRVGLVVFFFTGDVSLLPPCKMWYSPNFRGLPPSPGTAACVPLAPGGLRGAGLSPFLGAAPSGQGGSRLGPTGLCSALHAAAGAVPWPCRAGRQLPGGDLH